MSGRVSTIFIPSLQSVSSSFFHPLAEAACIGAAELRRHTLLGVRREVGPVVFDCIVGNFSRAGVTAQISQCATSSISLVGLVAAGVGIGVVVESLRCIARPDIRFVPLADEPPSLGHALCHRPDLPDDLRHGFARAIAAAVAGRGEPGR